MRNDHRHLTAYQIGCEVGQSVVLVLRPAILDRHILALDVAGFTNALPECGQIARTIGRRAAEEPDHRHRRLLRARRERPRHRRAADERNELAAPDHSITSSARARSEGGTSRPSALAASTLLLAGLMSVAMTEAVGTNSCANSSSFDANSTPIVVAPVTLPAGRLMLATRPICTGSLAVVKTMGVVVIAAFTASTTGRLATNTATRRSTSSSAITGTRSYCPSAQRYSTATFWPSK